jgi:hypothetical protein
MSNEPALAESDIGRIYIKGYLYPISYPKIVKKDIPYHFFERDMLRDIYPNFRDFKVVYPTLSYYILFRKKNTILGYFCLTKCIFLLNTEIICEFPLKLFELAIF